MPGQICVLKAAAELRARAHDRDSVDFTRDESSIQTSPTSPISAADLHVLNFRIPADTDLPAGESIVLQQSIRARSHCGEVVIGESNGPTGSYRMGRSPIRFHYKLTGTVRRHDGDFRNIVCNPSC